MITRTELGTVKSKANGTTLVLSDVALELAEGLIIWIGYDNSQGAPTVTWGTDSLVQRLVQVNAGTNRALASYVLSAPTAATKNVTMTWLSTIGVRVALGSSYTGVEAVDVKIIQAQDTVTNPATGEAPPNEFFPLVVSGCHMSVGPVSDTTGTKVGAGAIGQVDGTVGAPPVSNLKLTETYNIVHRERVEGFRSKIENATERDWVSGVLVLHGVAVYEVLTTTGLFIVQAPNEYSAKTKALREARSRYRRAFIKGVDSDTPPVATFITQKDDGVYV